MQIFWHHPPSLVTQKDNSSIVLKQLQNIDSHYFGYLSSRRVTLLFDGPLCYRILKFKMSHHTVEEFYEKSVKIINYTIKLKGNSHHKSHLWRHIGASHKYTGQVTL